MTSPRYLAVELLNKTFKAGGYSNIQLNSALSSSDMDERDKKLCTAIYYGVIERKITLDCVVSGLSSRPIEKLDDVILNILRCGIYQIMYMDNIPDSAAVSESVALAKKFRKISAAGMVNAILRSFIRSEKKFPCPKDDLGAASVRYSAPTELIESLIADYGRESAFGHLEYSLQAPEMYIRRNQLRCTEEELVSALGRTGIVPTALDGCYRAEDGAVINTEAFRRGFFHVQDMSSQLCCHALAPAGNDLVLDICAAPGGKTFTMAELMNGNGQIYAFDLHQKRVKLIMEGAQRLGLTNITAAVGDASRYNAELPQFTKILCDVPCSGIGVIARKPEIKYKSLSEFAGLPDIQYRIAENALRYLAPGGEMVYSTCTLRKAENDEVVDRLLSENPGLEPCELPELPSVERGSRATLFPGSGSGDGFFIAKFRKSE